MIKALAIEFQKTKHRKTLLIVAAMFLVQTLWFSWGLSDMDAHDLEQGWEMCFFQFSILNSIILPVVAAVIASRICDIEHKGQTFRQLETLIPAGRLFDEKFIFESLYILAATLLQTIYIIVLGLIKGFAGPPPMTMVGYYFLFTTSVNLTILLLQHTLSILFANQMISLTVGLLGGLTGIFLLYLPEIVSNFLIWGYYGVLLFIRMDWNRATRIVNYYYVPANWTGFFILVGMFCLIYLIGRRLFTRKDI